MNASEIAELNAKHKGTVTRVETMAASKGRVAADGDYASGGGHVFAAKEPKWTARPIATNVFQIFDGDKAVGETLTGTESALVLRWLTGKL